MQHIENRTAIARTMRSVKIGRSTLVGAIVTGPWVGVKRHVEETPHSRSGDFESIGEILRRMRREAEASMKPEFSLSLSRCLDCCLAMEQAIEEGQL